MILNDRFFILANDTESGNYAIFTTDVNKCDRKHWQNIVKDDLHFFIEDFEMFNEKYFN